MSFLGKGIVKWGEGQQPMDIATAPNFLSYHPIEIGFGKKLDLQIPPQNFPKMQHCLLCGSLIINEPVNDEHPVPSWLMRDTGTKDAFFRELMLGDNNIPARGDFSFQAHQHCNSEFGRLLEEKVKPDLNKILDGGILGEAQIDRFLDWLDKVRATVHISVLQAEGRLENYGVQKHNFPNKRVGLHDRMAFFFRVQMRDEIQGLQIEAPQNRGFQSTPTALVLRVKDLVIVSISDFCLLSSTLGIPLYKKDKNGSLVSKKGSGIVARTFSNRISRLHFARAIFQAMRPNSPDNENLLYRNTLENNGQGKLFTSMNSKIERVKSGKVDFSNLPTLDFNEGIGLACLEFMEAIIDCKKRDMRAKYPDNFFMKSIKDLYEDREEILEHLRIHAEFVKSTGGSSGYFKR
jgi:hypothetical protein